MQPCMTGIDRMQVQALLQHQVPFPADGITSYTHGCAGEELSTDAQRQDRFQPGTTDSAVSGKRFLGPH